MNKQFLGLAAVAIAIAFFCAGDLVGTIRTTPRVPPPVMVFSAPPSAGAIEHEACDYDQTVRAVRQLTADRCLLQRGPDWKVVPCPDPRKLRRRIVGEFKDGKFWNGEKWIVDPRFANVKTEGDLQREMLKAPR